MTCKEVMEAVVGFGSYCLWSPQRATIAKNTHAINHWEADILIIQESGKVYEIEVKVSVSDFRREFETPTKKTKHDAIQRGFITRSRPLILSRFYFAMPKDIYERVKGEIPEYAGVITVDVQPNHYKGKRLVPTKEIEAPQIKGIHATDADRVAVMRSVYLRAWGQFDEPVSEPSGNSGQLETKEAACG